MIIKKCRCSNCGKMYEVNMLVDNFIDRLHGIKEAGIQFNGWICDECVSQQKKKKEVK